MKKIQISGRRYKNKPIKRFVLVDDNDFNELNKFIWHFDGKYASRNIGYGKNIRLHIEIMNTPKGMATDHINGNRLDNRRENLRIVTPQQNSFNVGIKKKIRTSQFKGVFWFPRDKKWTAQISINKNPRYLGYFKTEHQAALMYDFWATELFGQFARTNFKVVAHNLGH